MGDHLTDPSFPKKTNVWLQNKKSNNNNSKFQEQWVCANCWSKVFKMLETLANIYLKFLILMGLQLTEVKCNHFCRYQTVYVVLNHYNNACCVLLKYKKLSSVSGFKVTA